MDNVRAQAIEQPLRLRPQPKALPDSVVSLLRVLSGSPAILALLALWEVAPRLGLVEPAFLPPFSEVLTALWALLRSGQLIDHVGASLSRSLVGFGSAIVLAVPLGLAIGASRRTYDFINPLLEVFRNTAALALLPVFILLLGIGESSKVAIVIYVCSWSILLNTISGVRNVDPLLIKSARTMGLGKAALLRKVTLPAALPTIFVGIRLAGSSSLLVLVAAEMVGAKAGLGYLIQYSQYNFQIPQMYAGIITTTALGLTFAKTLLWLERRCTSWKAPAPE
jgi:NitT/TauT family transport system permease protein